MFVQRQYLATLKALDLLRLYMDLLHLLENMFDQILFPLTLTLTLTLTFTLTLTLTLTKTLKQNNVFGLTK